MKKILSITLVAAMTISLLCCNSMTSDNHEGTHEYQMYNICLVIDGTDRTSLENGIPQVSVEEMTEIAKSISKNGFGTLYVCYVDGNCDNNKIALFDWDMEKPSAPGEKKGYEMMSKYEEKETEYSSSKKAYDDCLQAAISKFSQESATLTEMAYSDFVAKQKNGSDVNGAINQAIHLLQASLHGSEKSFIILVSDGCDNVGKELKELPSNMELLIVNTNDSRHQYDHIVSREFATLGQASNYIFIK